MVIRLSARACAEVNVFDLLASPETYLSLLTLSVMEVVLGIDNILFISILTAKLPPSERERARRVGLLGAFVTRIGFLLAISWLMGLTATLFSIGDHDVTGQGLILFVGGAFLIFKATREMHDKLEGAQDGAGEARARRVSFTGIVVQVVLLDIVFSIDSVITAVGMTEHVSIMIVANVVALGVMLWLGGHVAGFVERHPTVKMLALAFLLLIGVMLCAEAAGLHIPKGYLYSAMGFSVLVELLNLRTRRGKAIPLRNVPHASVPHAEEAPPTKTEDAR